MRSSAGNIRHLHTLRGGRKPMATGVPDTTRIVQELRSFYLALDYAICRECERPAASPVCSGCVKYFLVQGLAELADSVDGRSTREIVSSKDLLREMKLTGLVNNHSMRRALKGVQEVREAALDALSELVVYQDMELRIIWANKMAGQVFGVEPERLVGRHCYEVWYRRSEPCVGCPADEVRKTRQPRQTETVSPDGRVWFLRAYPVCSSGGDVTGIIEVALDITDRRRSERELREFSERLRQTTEGTVHALGLAVQARDPYTAGHQRRVAMLARAVARQMGLAEDRIDGLYLAGAIHDIGKIAIPTEILSKPGRLSGIERYMINAHPETGYSMLRSIPFVVPVAEIALQHHERLDGSGYPLRVVGEDILLEARILAVTDVIEAMASHRPYRPALGIDKALDEILQNRSILYDPAVVDACVEVFRAGFTWDNDAD